MGKYWVANNPNSEINDAKAQKLAELSATSVSLAELNALDADSTSVTITPNATSVADGVAVEVAVQFKDAAGAVLDYPVAFDWYLSSAATGIALDSATAVADGGAGFILMEHVANSYGTSVTDATGLCDIDITEAGPDVLYLVIVMPDRRLAISASMTWAS